MAGHAQLKFVMTECSKTQIRLTGLMYIKLKVFPELYLYIRVLKSSLLNIDYQVLTLCFFIIMPS